MERMQKRYEKKTMKGKKRKQRRGKEKRGSKGVSPCALQTQIFQKKEKKYTDEKNKEETTVHVQYASGLLQNFFGTFSNME